MKSVLSVIEEAIRTKTPICFEYVRSGKTPGKRIGNPHAAYIQRLKSGEERVYADIWQTGGVTDSGEMLPSWRRFFLNDISAVAVLPQGQPFSLAEGYNPASYQYPLAKA